MTISISCTDCGKQFRNISPRFAGKKARCSCGAVVRLGSAETDRPGKKKSHPGKKKSQRATKQKRGRRPAFEETYGDLDAILDEVGVETPAAVSSGPIRPRTVSARAVTQTEHGSSRRGPVAASPGLATIRFCAGIGASVIGFWFGVLIVVSRFYVFPIIGVIGVSTSLNAASVASFGDAEVASRFSMIFVTLGWMLWGAGLVMMFASGVQCVSTIVRQFWGRSLAEWSDGVAATAAVAAVFLMVALVFTQSSFRQNQSFLLDEFERPAVEAGEHLPQVELRRQDNDENNRGFTLSMLVGAGFPASIFVLSVVRLFVRSSLSHRSRGNP